MDPINNLHALIKRFLECPVVLTEMIFRLDESDMFYHELPRNRYEKVKKLIVRALSANLKVRYRDGICKNPVNNQGP